MMGDGGRPGEASGGIVRAVKGKILPLGEKPSPNARKTEGPASLTAAVTAPV
jgi:hypothetical protein